MPTSDIDRLKRELTDQYVVVSTDRPELARFAGVVGQVKTVNFSGRALVEFSGYLNNPAWHDIDATCLQVVDKPPDPEPAAKKPAKPAAKAPANAGGKSAADVLAAARGGGAAKPAGPASDAAGDAPKKPGDASKKKSPSVGKDTAAILAAARGGASADKPDGKKTSPSVGLSTADVLAAARGKKPANSSPKKQPAASNESGMTTDEILAAARAAKKPAHEGPKLSAIDELTAGAHEAAARRQLTAADIRDIGLGKLSIRREMHVATAPAETKPRHESTEAAVVEALPKKVDHTKLTAADILKMGMRK